MAHATDRNVEIMKDCHDICVKTVFHCLEMGGNHVRPDHITTLLDCAEICQTSANFMLRESELHVLSCAVCADICDRCAESCERLSDGDQMMRECAETCRRCAEACRQMAEGHRVEHIAAN